MPEENKNTKKQCDIHDTVWKKGKYGCGCNAPYPRYLHAKEKTKCMNCRTEY